MCATRRRLCPERPVDSAGEAFSICARLRQVEADAADLIACLGPQAALSHEEAARIHGIELVDDEGTRRATVPRNQGRAKSPGWRIARHDLTSDDVVLLDDVRVTSAERTVYDLTFVLALGYAVVAADSALRQGLVSLSALLTSLCTAQGRGANRPRAVARMLDPLSGSVLESMLRVILLSAGLPAPQSQFEISNEFGRFLARVDFCWVSERLVVEADGFAFHCDRAAYRGDRIRMNELERMGWRVLRFTWEDVMERPDFVVALVRQCLEHGVLAT